MSLLTEFTEIAGNHSDGRYGEYGRNHGDRRGIRVYADTGDHCVFGVARPAKFIRKAIGCAGVDVADLG